MIAAAASSSVKLITIATALGLAACTTSAPRATSPCTAADAERISAVVNTSIWNNPEHSLDRLKTMTLNELDAERKLNARLIEADMAAIRGDPEKSCQMFRQIAAEEHIAIP